MHACVSCVYTSHAGQQSRQQLFSSSAEQHMMMMLKLLSNKIPENWNALWIMDIVALEWSSALTCISGIPFRSQGLRWWIEPLMHSTICGSLALHCLMYSAEMKRINNRERRKISMMRWTRKIISFVSNHDDEPSWTLNLWNLRSCTIDETNQISNLASMRIRRCAMWRQRWHRAQQREAAATNAETFHRCGREIFNQSPTFRFSFGHIAVSSGNREWLWLTPLEAFINIITWRKEKRSICRVCLT